MPNGNSQQRSSPDTRVRHQQVGLNREVRVALLRVRTGPECPEDNLRELTCNDNPNHGIARERKKKRQNFPMKRSNLRHCRPTHRTKD